MKVSYKPVGSGNWTSIYDQGSPITGFDPRASSPAALPMFAPQFTPTTDRKPLAFSKPSFRAPRGNIVCETEFNFEIGYTSPALALASIRTYAALMDQLVQLRVQQDSEVQYYPNALVTSYGGTIANGVSVQHRFRFESDNVTATAPP